MSDYAVTGRKGTGKSKVAVKKMQEAMLAGRRVATNLNLFVEHLVPARNKVTPIRIPDRPSAADMYALGYGSPPEDKDEDNFGVIVLDEMATWMNTRNFNEKGRKDLLDWFLHARKFHWHIFYLMQHQNQVDKQLRESMFEYHVFCRRLDKVPIPILTSLVKLVGFDIRLPKMHVASVRLGMEHNAYKVDSWWYRGHDVHKGYDTDQVFREESDGIHCMLSAWHLKGRYLPPKPKLKDFGKALVRLPFLPMLVYREQHKESVKAKWAACRAAHPISKNVGGSAPPLSVLSVGELVRCTQKAPSYITTQNDPSERQARAVRRFISTAHA